MCSRGSSRRGGSVGHTSNAAPASAPDSSASTTASRSTIEARARLSSSAPGRIERQLTPAEQRRRAGRAGEVQRDRVRGRQQLLEADRHGTPAAALPRPDRTRPPRSRAPAPVAPARRRSVPVRRSRAAGRRSVATASRAPSALRGRPRRGATARANPPAGRPARDRRPPRCNSSAYWRPPSLRRRSSATSRWSVPIEQVSTTRRFGNGATSSAPIGSAPVTSATTRSCSPSETRSRQSSVPLSGCANGSTGKPRSMNSAMGSQVANWCW